MKTTPSTTLGTTGAALSGQPSIYKATSTTPLSTTTITTTNTPTPTTITTIPPIIQKQPEWARDSCDEILWKESDDILQKERKKISHKKKIMTPADLP